MIISTIEANETREWRAVNGNGICVITSLLLTSQPRSIHYFEVLIREFRKSHEFANVPVQILTEDFPTGLPAVLAELGDVVHYRAQVSTATP